MRIKVHYQTNTPKKELTKQHKVKAEYHMNGRQ
jgi:hypothetical protein